MKKAIAFKNVRKNYGQLKAVNGISLSVEQGEFFGLLGPNGAGKSTLINMLAGLVNPSSGSILAMGFDVVKDYQNARHSLGIVPQELVFDPFFNLREMLRFQAGYFGKGKSNDIWIDEVIERLDLTTKASTNMRKLSGGMKRRALIAQALVHRPPVIVLDEPTAGVDVELRQNLWKNVRSLNNQGVTIILTTHYLEEAEEMCDRIAILNKGSVVALDSTKNLLDRIQTKKVTFKTDKIINIKDEDINSLKIISKLNTEICVSFEKNKIHMEELINLIKKNNVKILDISTDDVDLEDVFLRLIKN